MSSTLFTSNICSYTPLPLPLIFKAPQFLSFSVPRTVLARSAVSTRVKRKKKQPKDKDAAPLSAAEKSLRYAFMEELMLRARNQDTAGVSDVLADMIAAGLKPGPRSFHGLVVSHALNHDLQGAMHSLKRELSTGLRPLHETFVALLRLYASRGEATGGFEILSAMDRFDYDIRPAWLFLVEELVRNNHLEKANQVFLKGSKGGLRATDELYDLLIVEDCKAGDHSNALDVAYEMEAYGRMATTFHFNCLLSVQATCGIPEMAYTTYENMAYAGEEFMKPDTETYNWVIQAYTRAESYDRVQDVSEVLGMMLEDHKRLQPNARTHALLVECFTKYCIVREAIRHYRALANFEGGTKLLHNEGKFGDPLSLYLRALCREGRIVELLEALDAMAKDNQPIPRRAMIVSRKYRTLVSSWIEPLLEEADHGFEIDYISRYIAEGGLTGERKRWVPRSGDFLVDPDAEGFAYSNPMETSFKQRCLEDWKTHHAKIFRFLRSEGCSALGDATESDYKKVMDRLKKILKSPSKRVLKPKAASKMLVAELKEELEAQDLPTDGTRNVLYQRVQKARRINLSRGRPLWIPPVEEEEEEVDEEIDELISRVDLQEGNTEFWKRRFLGEGLNGDHGKPIDVDALETQEESDDESDDDDDDDESDDDGDDDELDTEEVEDYDAEEEEVEQSVFRFEDEDDDKEADSPLQMIGSQLLKDSAQTTRRKNSRNELQMLSNDKDGVWFPMDISGALKELRERNFYTESDMYTLADAWGWTWERELRSRPPQRWSQEWEVELSVKLMQKVIELGGTPTIGDCAMILRAAIQAPMPSVFLKILALRTPFVKSGSTSLLKIEINDPSIEAIQFLIVNEAQNKWFKNNGDNFHVKLPVQDKLIPIVSVPEDLVQVQAYLRWERNGKQMYTPEQEKVEYEAARTELWEEVARGTSIEDLRAKLANKNGSSAVREESLPETKGQIPNELDGQKEVTKGEAKNSVAKKPKTKKYLTAEKIQRKKRDPMQLLNKYEAKPVEEKYSSPAKPKVLTAVELFAKAELEQEGDNALNKKIFKLADKDLLVLVTKPAGKTKILLVTDFKEPVTIHWALSKARAGEWLAPPPDILPAGSVSLDGAAETQFTSSVSADPFFEVQSVGIEIEDDSFTGMPFVLVSGSNWIKNKGSDFYIDFGAGFKQVQKVLFNDRRKDAGVGKGTAKALLDRIANQESEAQKSFMHRFNIASDLINQAKDSGESGLAGILVWMRFMATRQLIWNKNYNVKPREISRAQDRLTDALQNIYINQPEYHELLRMIMSTVGRGGEGDVGQRIRDEILVIQRKNDCKGGMMEEWHQKLHNNTSPDDVIICQALIDYIKSDFDISVYWKTLNENGITKERLLSYDRAIRNEPKFRSDQKDGLLRDLGSYMRTLKAVHSGADLESAISNCMGYKSKGQGFMVGVQINPISGLPSGFPELLQFVLEHVEDKKVEALLEGLLESRQELRPMLFKPHDRLKDLLFLDIALDSTVRTAIERGYEELNNAGPEKIMCFISLVLENLALSSNDNEDLIYCMKGWYHALNMFKSKDHHWALYAKSVLDRTRLALAHKAESYERILQPSAEYLGTLLGVDQWAVNIFTEEIIRAGSAASLSSLLNRLDPVLRKTANLGSWQVISPVEAIGYVVVVDELLAVQNKTYAQPTILVAKSVKGEEEIPDGAVAVLTPDMPDVLSHVSVRARNSKVCFATCFDPNILSDLEAKEGKLLCLKPTSADVVYSEVKEGELGSASSSQSIEDGSLPSLNLVRKQFSGRYAISSEEFTSEMVGAKSRNISYLKGKVPSWIGIPTSVALPFGAFEKVLSDNSNQAVAEKLVTLKKKLGESELSALGEIRETVLQLAAPPQLVKELKTKMQSSEMPWPGDEGEKRWEQAWTAIKKVWASKWNERAYFSTRKLKLDHDSLCMAVLVQEIINADYAFVIHTTNPSSGDSSEIYAEVVKGLGETLVGAYPGRALSFVCKKNDLNSPQVLGYPSKPIGLFIRRSIIFRSDSNGEDLEGYAGAGLYDSVPMDEEEKVVLDYSTDPLMIDGNLQQKILSSIARAGNAIEELYGSAQDIEGVIRDGKLYVVQTRPQM